MMKLKKILTGRPFIMGTLTVLCVGAFAISLCLNSDRSPKFTPDPAPAGQLTDNWEENRSDVPSGTPVSPAALDGENVSKAEKDEYPKEVQNKDNNVTVNFTDPGQQKPSAPEKPAISGDTKNPDKPPEYKNEKIKPPASPSGTPAPGSKNDKGEVYDPVFGWIKPGAANSKPIHNNGDPNKQIGSME